NAAGGLTDGYFGNGRLYQSGVAVPSFTLQTSGALGTNITGGNFVIAAGKSTGSAILASILFQTGTVGGSGSTPQTLATRLTISDTVATFTLGVVATDLTTSNVPLANIVATDVGGKLASAPVEYYEKDDYLSITTLLSITQ